MSKLTIIHANDPDLLQQFRRKATHWLPEYHPDNKPKYATDEVICTTADTFIDLIKMLIQNDLINHNQVIYINVESMTNIITYTFGPDGDFENFFRVQHQKDE